jgi:hypothetical protein
MSAGCRQPPSSDTGARTVCFGHDPESPKRWIAIWGANFGSTGHTGGDAAIGPARRNLSDGHLACGADLVVVPGSDMAAFDSDGASGGLSCPSEREKTHG